MSLIAAIAVLVGFLALLHLFALPRLAARAMTESRGALHVVGDKSLGDQEKERAVRALALRLFGLTGRLLLGGVLAVALPFALVAGVGALTDTYTIDAVNAWLLSWPLLVAGTVVAVAVLVVDARRAA